MTSLARLHLMRALFLLNVLLLGSDVWPAILSRGGAMEPLEGVAFSFWGTLSALSLLGLRYPLQMLPLLLTQFVYKVVWLLAVALPQWAAVRSLDLTFAMCLGVVLDLIVIPWGYVLASYVRRPGEPWRRATATVQTA
jgi:hypothetical protein